MKKAIFALLIVLAFSVNVTNAQIPDGFKKGSVVLANNSKMEGAIKEALTSKGTIVFVSASGSKKTYSVSELTSFEINGENYIAYANDFYKAAISGAKANLYQKQTNNSGKLIYNGADAYTATTTDGRIGDWYIQVKSSDDLLLVTAKNFETVVSTGFADCSAVLADLKSKQLDYAQLSKVVEKYNSCK